MKNLAAKMIKIMEDVSYIQKKGFNAFQKYKYATESDVSTAFAESFKKNNVCMLTSVVERNCDTYKTAQGKDSFIVSVKMEVTFIDADSGESFTGTFFGDGTDSGDKGVYKAITGAQKYALMKTFMVSTGDDPECDHKEANYKPEKDEKLMSVLKLIESAKDMPHLISIRDEKIKPLIGEAQHIARRAYERVYKEKNNIERSRLESEDVEI